MYFTLCFFFSINWFIREIYVSNWIRNIITFCWKQANLPAKEKKGGRWATTLCGFFFCTCITLLGGIFIYYHPSKLNYRWIITRKNQRFFVFIKTNSVNYSISKLDIKVYVAGIRPLKRYFNGYNEFVIL